MKVRTHFNLARISMDKIEKSNNKISYSEIGKLAFYLGTVTPDLSITQFIRPHFYAKSADYVFKKINVLKGKAYYDTWDMYQLGRISHYLNDFCCQVHASGGVGNVSEHIKYEKKINKYLINNFQSYKRILSKFSVNTISGKDIVEKLKAIIEKHSSSLAGLHNDVSNALEISTALCLSL